MTAGNLVSQAHHLPEAVRESTVIDPARLRARLPARVGPPQSVVLPLAGEADHG
jgi:hypothetical protein